MGKKATNRILTFEYINDRAEGLKTAGYDKSRWITFCEIMMKDGFTLSLYEARETVSKYITVLKPGCAPFKVRFSNHRPILAKELNGDCDFFVGHTNLRITNTGQAVSACRQHFAEQEKKNGNNG